MLSQIAKTERQAAYSYLRTISDIVDLLQQLDDVIYTEFILAITGGINMKLNTDKCHLIIAGNKYEHIWAKLGEELMWENSVKLLGVTIDRQLKFDKHVFYICTKAGRKLSALTRMISYLTFDKKRRLLKTFFESQFKYCLLTWMFHSRELNNRINRLHKRALRLIYNNFTTSFEQLLDKDNSFTIHQQNIQSLTIEM